MVNRFTLPLTLLSILLLLLLLDATVAQAQMTYYWRGAPGANFTRTADNWCTSPTAPVTTANRRNNSDGTDVLVFSGGSPVVTMNTGQTIGRLSFINNTLVTLNSSSNTTNTIVINGDAADDDLIVESGSVVSLTATGTPLNKAGVVLSLLSNATGKIAGTITLTNTLPNADAPVSTDMVSSATSNALHFTAGGQLNIFGTIGSTAFSGSPVFEAGSTLEQNAATSSDISGVSFAEYRSGSTFRFIDGVFGSLALSTDRIFGNLEYACSVNKGIGGPLNLTILNNLTITGTGSLLLSARGNASTSAIGTLIGGNISITNPASTLTFDSGTAKPNVPKVTLNGTSPQTISSVTTIAFGPNTKLEINNVAGVTLLTDLSIANDLLLTNGLLTTRAMGAGLLTMSNPVAAATGSITSFVNGPLARQTPIGGATLTFSIGKVGTDGLNKYRPITLALSNQDNAVTYTAQQTEASAVAFGVTAPLHHVSNRRYFTVAAAPAPTGSTFNASITLSFGLDDYVNNPTAASLVVAKRNTGAWANIGSTNTGADTSGGALSAGTLTSNGFSTFSDFTLASTLPSFSFSGLNPLPVSLVHFTAAAKGTGVALSWATASEKNSAHFDVQRSATGEGYETIGRVAAQGTSTSRREYAFTDAHPLAGRAYYRLRQVDVDGTTAHSPVATAHHRPEIAIYPNPATEALTLPASLGPVHYRILSSLGQAVASGQATGGDRLDLGTLPKGAFFLELTDAAGRHMQRLMHE